MFDEFVLDNLMATKCKKGLSSSRLGTAVGKELISQATVKFSPSLPSPLPMHVPQDCLR